jgi:hypothetical protein
LPRGHSHRLTPRPAPALEIPPPPWPPLHGHQEGMDKATSRVATDPAVAVPGARGL